MNHEKKELLDNRYLKIDEIYNGVYSDVLLVQDLKEDNKIYIMKLFKPFKESFNCFKKEEKINKIIDKLNNPSFIKYITSSNGFCTQKDKNELTPYIIFEYASKGDIIGFIENNCGGFSEKNCKLLFAKILKIVKTLHDFGFCHRDLKLDNFVFDGDKYFIKLIDFAYSEIIPKNYFGEKQLIRGVYGTKEYMAPEIRKGLLYDGEKADIFSLGVILFTLRTGNYGFGNSQYNPNSNDSFENIYKYIKEKNYDLYWQKIGIKLEELSEDFKDLYLRMVSFIPGERPTIEQIFNHKWMKEIRDLNEESEEYENDLIKELKNREEALLYSSNSSENL